MTNFLLGIVVIMLLIAFGLLSQVVKQQAVIVRALMNASEALRLNQQTCVLVVNQLTRLGTTLTSTISHQQTAWRPN